MTDEVELTERERVVKAIEAITAELKGPMSNLERQLLVLDRKDARDRLAELDAKAA